MNGEDALLAFVGRANKAQKAVDDIIDMHGSMGMHVVMQGDPVDGFMIYGPFKTGMDAADWAALNCEPDWWIAKLLEPKNLLGE